MSKQFMKKFDRKKYYSGIFLCLFLIFVPDCLIALGADQKPNLNTFDTSNEPKKDDGISFPKIIVDEKVFNFETVYEGEPVVHTFTIKNAGSDILVIEKVKPS